MSSISRNGRINQGIVWSDPNVKCESMGEMKGFDSEDKIAKDLSERIGKLLFGYGMAKDVVSKLIYEAIREQIQQYIREYDNVVAEDMLRSIRSTMKVGLITKYRKPDYDHARHAKLCSFSEKVGIFISDLTFTKELKEKITNKAVNDNVNLLDILNIIEDHFNNIIKDNTDVDINVSFPENNEKENIRMNR